MKAPLDIDALNWATVLALRDGHRLFHTHRVDGDDREQARYILSAAGFPEGALVLDAGCGIGELAHLMSKERADLKFILANLSHYQLTSCPIGPQFHWLHADCHDLPLEPEIVDAVMFVSALTQMDAKFVLHEASRVLKRGGQVFLFEMVHENGDPDAFEAVTTARVHTFEELKGFGESAGLTLDYGYTMDADDTHFRGLLREIGRDHLLDAIRPAIMRFFKG